MAADAIFVTGASGFIGGALTRALIADGGTVRALVRSDASAAAVEALGAEPVRGDLSDPASIRAGAQDCGLAFHAAALPAEWGTRAEFEAANVMGTANVLGACEAAGVSRLVHVGTEAAHFAMEPLVGDRRERAVAARLPGPLLVDEGAGGAARRPRVEARLRDRRRTAAARLGARRPDGAARASPRRSRAAASRGSAAAST